MNAKSTALSLSLAMAIFGVSSAHSEDQYLPAESLLIKGFHLGMNVDEVKSALEEVKSVFEFSYKSRFDGKDHEVKCGIDNGMTSENKNTVFLLCTTDDKKDFGGKIGYKPIYCIFNEKNQHLERFELSNRIFNIGKSDIQEFIKSFYDHYKLEKYFSKLYGRDQAVPSKEDNARCSYYHGMNCINNYTGLKLSLSGDELVVERIQSIDEKKQEAEQEEKEKREAAKNLKFD